MKKILVPVDGSRLSSYVINLALEFAYALNCQITLLTVVPGNNQHAGDSIYKLEQTQAVLDSQKRFHEEAKKNALKMLNSLVDNLQVNNLISEKLVKSGEPVEQILKIAESGQYDLIVIGNRGMSPTKKFFMGSVSKGVITGAKCPVLVAKQP